MGLGKINKQFFNFNYFEGHFVTRTSLLCENQHTILTFLIPHMTYFKKKINLSEGPFVKFFHTKIEKR
jgi:hypothetical protein